MPGCGAECLLVKFTKACWCKNTPPTNFHVIYLLWYLNVCINIWVLAGVTVLYGKLANKDIVIFLANRPKKNPPPHYFWLLLWVFKPHAPSVPKEIGVSKPAAFSKPVNLLNKFANHYNKTPIRQHTEISINLSDNCWNSSQKSTN